jgi:hypothetical protein
MTHRPTSSIGLSPAEVEYDTQRCVFAVLLLFNTSAQLDCTHYPPSCLIDDANYRELVLRLSTALAMVEASYLEARRKGG